MKEIYIVESSYVPTSASTNRLFAFAHQLYLKGIKPHFFYLTPDQNNSKSNIFTDEFIFHYLWEGSAFGNKYLCAIASIRKLHSFYTPSIPVYVYSCLNLLYFIKWNKKIKLYHEYTENPNAVGILNNCVGRVLYNLYKKTVCNCDGLFVITPSLKDFFIAETGITPDKVVVLNMVVDVNRFKGLEDINTKDRISYCGIISERKDGISYLLKAFAIVVQKYPELKLYVMGRFENNDVKDMVENIIRDLNLANNVVFTGSISPADMPKYLRESKVLALARPRQKEVAFGFATKIGEYLISERPVVMTNVGNVTDYLTDMENVILAKPNDEVDFADKLLWVLNNYNVAQQIGKRGKEVALQYFNAEVEVEKIYNRIFC